jgi:hypothetical protein
MISTKKNKFNYMNTYKIKNNFKYAKKKYATNTSWLCKLKMKYHNTNIKYKLKMINNIEKGMK